MFLELGETSGRKFMWYMDKPVDRGGAHGALYLGRKCSTVSGPY